MVKFAVEFCWEVLNGVGVIFPFFSFFFVFLRFFVFFRFSSLFFAFLRFSSFFFVFCLFSWNNGKRLLGKWGISLRPRLHRPRSELPDFGGNCFWRFSRAKEARKTPAKLRRKFVGSQKGTAEKSTVQKFAQNWISNRRSEPMSNKIANFCKNCQFLAPGNRQPYSFGA